MVKDFILIDTFLKMHDFKRRFRHTLQVIALIKLKAFSKRKTFCSVYLTTLIIQVLQGSLFLDFFYHQFKEKIICNLEKKVCPDFIKF